MPSDLKMNTCDLKSKVKRVSLATWQKQWELSTNQMLNIKRTTKRWKATWADWGLKISAAVGFIKATETFVKALPFLLKCLQKASLSL
jgi:hypothetical protein